MGSVIALYRKNYDFVDHKYFTVFQVPLYNIQNQKIENTIGQVTLYSNICHNDKESKAEIEMMNKLNNKYKDKGLRVFGLPTTDLTYDELYTEIMKFKPTFDVLKPTDCNGMEMSEIFRYLKRYSPLFNVHYGKSRRINTHFNKFLCDRYGILHKFYPPGSSYEAIEEDIKNLLEEKFDSKEYDSIVNPPEDIF